MNYLSKILRTIIFILVGLSVGLTLLGGIGTSCVALAAEKFGPMAVLSQVKWLYIVLMVISIAAGIIGIQALIGWSKGNSADFKRLLIILIIGGAAALVQVLVSRSLRGKSMPTDVRLYVTVLTLIVLLFLRIPRFYQGLGFDHTSSGSGVSGGAAAIVLGALILTVHIWAAPTHTIDGINYADVWHLQLSLAGWFATLAGVSWIGYDIFAVMKRKKVDLTALYRGGNTQSLP